ncbi:uncharacterized protein METZ01_LOCUS200062, partial [marine metagenome]
VPELYARSPPPATERAALALASVKYKFVEPSDRSSESRVVSAAATTFPEDEITSVVPTVNPYSITKLFVAMFVSYRICDCHRLMLYTELFIITHHCREKNYTTIKVFLNLNTVEFAEEGVILTRKLPLSISVANVASSEPIKTVPYCEILAAVPLCRSISSVL